MLDDARVLKHILEQKGIPHWIDFWGHDVNTLGPGGIRWLPYFLDKSSSLPTAHLSDPRKPLETHKLICVCLQNLEREALRQSAGGSCTNRRADAIAAAFVLTNCSPLEREA